MRRWSAGILPATLLLLWTVRGITGPVTLPLNKGEQFVDRTLPFRTIAILENERRIEAEPSIRLTEYFHSKSPEIRARSVLAAGRIGNPSVLPELRPLIQDRKVFVRKCTAFAIGQIRAKDGLAQAARLLKDQDQEVRRLAIEAVGRIGGLDSTETILPYLRDPNSAIREQTALSLALIKDKSTVQPLIEMTAREDSAQWSYVYALYRLADERSLSVLHHVLANPSSSPSTGDPSSLLFALKALWSMKKPLTGEEADRLLSHQDARVQQNALDVLAVATDQSLCDQVQKNYSEMNLITKGKALETLGALGCEIPQPDSPRLQGQWIIAQAKKNKEKSLGLLQNGSKNESWVVRWRTAQAFSELPAEVAIPTLKEMARDPDSAVRLAALDSLSKYLPETADFFLSLVDSKDFAVRATAIDALGKTKDRKYLPLIIKTYEASQNPTEIEGRVTILDTLSEFHSSETLRIYEEALQDAEYTIRQHAIDGLKKLVGTKYYREGQSKDPEDFLHLSGKLPARVQASYPKDFGSTQQPFEVTMKLEKGDVRIRLLAEEAPVLAENFRKLAERGVYNGLRIHRVVPNFVIQGGDPRGDGWGGAGEVIHDQINMLTYKRGMVGMPIAGKDTGGSQFFITHSRQPHLDGNYTIFGEVISGMDIVDQTEVGDKIISVIPKR
jgi:cyclophilin family peptidyl-prolyl cis-trans isomerase/HEAT repeat protein